MAAKRRNSRLVMTVLAVLVFAAVLVAAFWPRPVLVDMGPVRRGAMAVTINEEGRTRVKDPYVVSSPVAGDLQRVSVLPGEVVIGGVTVVAWMQPANPSALDVRTREQARAAVNAAQAALRVAEADLNAALANRDYAESELKRMQELIARGTIAKSTLERTEQAARVAEASVATAQAAIEMRKAELNNARAQLIGIDDKGLAAAISSDEADSAGIPLRAPIDGTILQVFHQSETTLPAGEAILEIGDVEGDLEVVVDLLSSDAVQVTPGDPVVITNWGGDGDLAGRVVRIDPFGFTKVSALGVEEQRVQTTIRFEEGAGSTGNLGHGYRVDVRIVIWQSDQTLIVPSSALFRQGGQWRVFQVSDGRAVLRPVEIGRDNGVDAEILSGLAEDDEVILFPSSGLTDGARVAQRVID